MEAGIQQRLSADSTLLTLVTGRIYPVILPNTPTLPAITYQRISTVRDYATTGPVSLSRIRLQFDSWGRTYAQVKQTDLAIRASLETFSGTLPDGTQVSEIHVDSSQDLYEADAKYYRVSTDYIIFAVE